MIKTYSSQQNILVVDEAPICYIGFVSLLQNEDQFTLLPQAKSLTEALLSPEPSCIALDLSAAKSKGIGAIRELRARFSKTPILVFTGHDETLFAERCLKSGANGYLMKSAEGPEVLRAIKCVSSGSLYVSERVKSLMLRRIGNPAADSTGLGFDRLSDRELLIVEQIGLSKNNKEIAQELQISVKTIESHRSRIKAKLQLESPQELMRYAMRLHSI